MKYIPILLVLVCVCLPGCGDDSGKTSTKMPTVAGEDTNAINSSGSKTQVRRRRTASEPVPKQERLEHHKNPVSPAQLHKAKPVLSAKEQLKRYYDEKGIPFPDSAQQSAQLRKRREHTRIKQKSVSIENLMSEKTQTVESIAQESGNLNPVLGVAKDDEVYQPDYSDAQPPELIAVRFVPDQVKPGDTVSVLVQAVDNLSGVRNIYGMVVNPSASAKLSFSCSFVNNDGTFEGALKIPRLAQDGTWQVTNLRLMDNVNNTKNYRENSPVLQNACFNVVSQESDTDPPHLIAVDIEPHDATGAERVMVMIQAEDNKSGVARVYGTFKSPSKNARIAFTCTYIQETNEFEGYVTIPDDAESGYWIIDYVRLEDNAKNSVMCLYRNFKQLFDNAKINVYTSGSDGRPPVLENILVYPPSVAYAETVEITVSVSDDVSGVATVAGSLISPSGRARTPFYCAYNHEKDEYSARIIIQENTEVGVWRVENVMVVDNARNQENYIRQNNPLIEQATFEVVGE